MQVSSGREDVERFAVRLCEALLALEDTLVDGDDRGIVLAGVIDRLGVTKGRVGVEKVVGPRGESDPFRVGLETTHGDAEAEPGVLDLGAHAAGPLVKSLPSGLDAADDALFEMGRVLLHDDDRLLQSILFLDLTLKLAVDGRVGREGVFLGSDRHGCILEQGDRLGEIRDHLGRHFPLLGDAVGELASVLLNILDVGLDFRTEFLEVLNNASLDCFTEVGVVVCNDARLVADAVVNVLDAVFAEELVALAKGDLDDASELGEFLGSVVLNVGNAFKVGNQLLDNVLPAFLREKKKVSGVYAVVKRRKKENAHPGTSR